MQVACRNFIRCFCMIMHPVPVPQATASRIEMKLAVKVSQYIPIQSSEGCSFGISSVKPALGLINA